MIDYNDLSVKKLEEKISIKLDFDVIPQDFLLKMEDKIFFTNLEMTFNFVNEKDLEKSLQRYFNPIQKLSWIKFKTKSNSISISLQDYFSFLISDRLGSVWFEWYTHFLLKELFYYDFIEKISLKKWLLKWDFMAMLAWKRDKNPNYNNTFDCLRKRDNQYLRKYWYFYLDDFDNNYSKNGQLDAFLSFYEYKISKSKKEHDLYKISVLYSIYLDIDLFLIIDKRNNFIITDKKNLDKYIMKWAYILNLSEQLRFALKDRLENIKDFELIKEKIKKEFWIKWKSNIEKLTEIINEIIQSNKIFQNWECYIDLKNGFANYLEIKSKTQNTNLHELETQISWYKEINMIYERDTRVWTEVKTKRKIEK